MQSASAFLDITKVAGFHWKNADVGKQGVCYMISIFSDLL